MEMTLGRDVLVNIQNDEAYRFLREDERIKGRLTLLGLGGSHAYGMNKEGSDMDIRGVALNTKDELLLHKDFEQLVDIATDTVIYSHTKFIKLLSECNPNTLEILGLYPEQYLKIGTVGQMLIDNKDIFLSRRVVNTFGGYANQQLRRLENKADAYVSQPQHIRHIVETLEHARYNFADKYKHYSKDILDLYVREKPDGSGDHEIVLDFHMTEYPLEEFVNMMSELQNIVRAYDKLGKRNKKAIDRDKLGKHMAHLFRLYYMCFDILTEGEIKTFRDEEHDELMFTRNNGYLTADYQPTREFLDKVAELDTKLKKLGESTTLPVSPNYAKIEELTKEINNAIIRDEL